MSDVPTAGEYMSRCTFAVHPEDDMFGAIVTLVYRGLPAVPVIDNEDRLVGILTDKDCLRIVSHSAYEGYPGGLHVGKVSDYMSPVKATLEPRMDMFVVAGIFLETHFVTLPVLEEGKVVGVITRRDVLRGIQAWQRRVEAAKSHDREAIERAQKRPTSIEQMQKVLGSHKKEQVAEVFRRGRKS